jgi:hypothetical protein
MSSSDSEHYDVTMFSFAGIKSKKFGEKLC